MAGGKAPACALSHLTGFTDLLTPTSCPHPVYTHHSSFFQEWGVDEIDMAVPLSPTELMIKRHAIYKHQVGWRARVRARILCI
jgi:hypothetical protein